MKYLIIGFCLLFNLSIAQKTAITEHKFVIVLDVQNYYTCNKTLESSSKKLIDSVNKVIDNSAPNRIIYVKSTHKLLNLSLSFPFIYTSFDSTAMLFDKRINIVNDNIYTKEKASAFSVKQLNEFLQKNGAKEIVIIGLLAEQCVYNSLIEGLKLGYKMYVIPEAIVGKSEKSKEDILKKLANKGVKQLTINDLN